MEEERDGAERSHMAPMRNPIPGQSNIRDSETCTPFSHVLRDILIAHLVSATVAEGRVPLRYKLFPPSVSPLCDTSSPISILQKCVEYSFARFGASQFLSYIHPFELCK